MGSQFKPTRRPLHEDGDDAQAGEGWNMDEPSADADHQPPGGELAPPDTTADQPDAAEPVADAGDFRETAPAPTVAPDPEPAAGGILARLMRDRQTAAAPVAESAASAGDGNQDLGRLRNENAQLKKTLDAARQRLAQMEKAANSWQSREQNYEALIEEKSERIAQLEAELGEAHTRSGPGKAQGVLTEEELLEIQRQLEEEHQTIQQERQDMEGEFKKIEISMSKERAEVARSRREIEKMKRDLELQIETVMRDEKLRGLMGPILQMQNELKSGKSASSGSGMRPVMGRPNTPPQGQYPAQPSGTGFVPPPPSPPSGMQAPQAEPHPAEPPPQKQGGSIFRKFFKG